MTLDDLHRIETTEALAIMASFSDTDCSPMEFEVFNPDVAGCTKDFIADLNTLIRDMDNVYFIRISN